MEYGEKDKIRWLDVCMSYLSNLFKLISKSKTDETQTKKLVYKTFFNNNFMLIAQIIKLFTSIITLVQ